MLILSPQLLNNRLFNEEPPLFIEEIGYETCKWWLAGGYCQDILPRQQIPQSGEEAVEAFAPQLALPARNGFVSGWNRCLAECGFIS
jgi:hypothetical protein